MSSLHTLVHVFFLMHISKSVQWLDEKKPNLFIYRANMCYLSIKQTSETIQWWYIIVLKNLVLRLARQMSTSWVDPGMTPNFCNCQLITSLFAIQKKNKTKKQDYSEQQQLKRLSSRPCYIHETWSHHSKKKKSKLMWKKYLLLCKKKKDHKHALSVIKNTPCWETLIQLEYSKKAH